MDRLYIYSVLDEILDQLHCDNVANAIDEVVKLRTEIAEGHIFDGRKVTA